MKLEENNNSIRNQVMENICEQLDIVKTMLEDQIEGIIDKKSEKEYAFNRLIYGAPGTGKSYLLEEDRKVFVGENYERVTFYEDYSYGQFIGSYKPISKGDNIVYKFIPGPFLRLVVKALNAPKENFVLIIEEMNRARAASVFGDMFQLLDRNEITGEGEYEVTLSEEVKEYLIASAKKYYIPRIPPKSIKMPKNLYIWSTMNSADQGVFPLDTAFKRRFDEYKLIGINENASEKCLDKVRVNIKCNSIGDMKWDTFRRILNEFLIDSAEIKDDKLIGPFFIKLNILQDDEKFQKVFKNKLLMYLSEDILRHKKDKLFSGKSLSRILDAYGKENEKSNKYTEILFIDDFESKVKKAQEKDNMDEITENMDVATENADEKPENIDETTEKTDGE